MHNVTFIIHTFKRPDCLARLLTSIEQYYHEQKVIIYDDSEHDRGLSWGRNYLVSQVKTKYYLLLDDDFVFTEKTRIESLLNKLKEGYDIVGGALEENGEIRHFEGHYQLKGNHLHYCYGEPYDFVFNFFLAKKEVTGWDERLKVAEHTAFFFDNQGKWKIGYGPECVVSHQPERDDNYMEYRARAKHFLKLWMNEKNIHQIVSFTGIYSFHKQPKKNPLGKRGRVSVIIPCYNYSHFLTECVESVRNQTYKNIDIIVVNDGSTDDINSVVKKLGVRCINQTNQGLASARNTGIDNATGEWIICLDADDKLFPDCIELLMGWSYDIIGFGMQEFGERSGRVLFDEYPTLKDFMSYNRIHCSAMFRKSMWQELCGYDERLTKGLEDWHFWIRALKEGYTIKNLQEPLMYYRIHPNSMSVEMHKNYKEIEANMFKLL